jgi:hypothetical protein
VCGGALTASQPPTRHNPSPLYTCKPHSCVAVREDWLDGYITGQICARLDRPEFWEEILRGGDTVVQAARAEEAELQDRLDEHIEAASKGALSAESLGRLERILTPQITAAARRAESIAVPVVLRNLRQGDGTLREAFTARPVAVRKAIIRELTKSITLHRSQHRGRNTGFDPERVTVEWKDPG